MTAGLRVSEEPASAAELSNRGLGVRNSKGGVTLPRAKVTGKLTHLVVIALND